MISSARPSEGFEGAPEAVFPARYDAVTIALHWAVALGVALQWVGGHTIDWFPRGAPKIDARSAHILLGASLSLLLLSRLYWRARKGARLAPAEAGVPRGLAAATHGLLYATLAGLLGLGLFLAWLRGDSLLGLAHIPRFGAYEPSARHALANQVTSLHSLAANALLCLAGLHAGAALLHRFYWRDGVLQRMLPR
jgi:cytochrome b561